MPTWCWRIFPHSVAVIVHVLKLILPDMPITLYQSLMNLPESFILACLSSLHCCFAQLGAKKPIVCKTHYIRHTSIRYWIFLQWCFAKQPYSLFDLLYWAYLLYWINVFLIFWVWFQKAICQLFGCRFSQPAGQERGGWRQAGFADSSQLLARLWVINHCRAKAQRTESKLRQSSKGGKSWNGWRGLSQLTLHASEWGSPCRGAPRLEATSPLVEIVNPREGGVATEGLEPLPKVGKQPEHSLVWESIEMEGLEFISLLCGINAC